jgi:hypothetical protein
MKHDDCVRAFMESDTVSAVSLGARVHALRCAACRAEIHRVSRSLSLLRRYQVEPEGEILLSVMAKIRCMPESTDTSPEQSLAGWLVAGLILMVSMFLVPFGEAFDWADTSFGMGFSLPLSLVLGSAMTVYATLFVMTHMERCRAVLEHARKLLVRGARA